MDIKNVLKNFFYAILVSFGILDFLNFLNDDFDFLKKIISWFLITILFYKISPSKIFFGIRKKSTDFFLIFGFFLTSIFKSLFQYLFFLDSFEFELFESLILFLISLKPFYSIIIDVFFIFGVILIIFTTLTSLISNNLESGLIKSFQIEKNFFGVFFEKILGVFLVLFFGIVIFNFFMEWFALAVDSIILFIGFIYALIKLFISFMSHRFFPELENKLSEISNFGFDVYNYVLSLFSEKKTFLLGFLFVLSFHLVVDSGVYFFSYLSGLTDTFYLKILGSNQLSIFGIGESHFLNDMKVVPLWFGTFLFILYFLEIFFIFTIFVFPFVMLYKKENVLKENLEDFILALFFSSFIIYSFGMTQILYKNIFIFEILTNEFISGLYAKTSNLILDDSNFYLILLLLLFSFCISYLFVKNFKVFSRKLFTGIIVLFFLIYSFTFLYSNSNIIETSHYNESKYLEVKNDILGKNGKFKKINFGELLIFDLENYTIIKFDIDNLDKNSNIRSNENIFYNKSDLSELLIEGHYKIIQENPTLYIKTDRKILEEDSIDIVSLQKVLPKVNVNMVFDYLIFSLNLFRDIFLIVFYILSIGYLIYYIPNFFRE